MFLLSKEQFLKYFFWITFTGVLLLFFVDISFAAESASLPHESTLNEWIDSLSGPIAYSICIASLIASVVAWLGGGEITGLVKTLGGVFLGSGIVIFAAEIMEAFTGESAVIGSAVTYTVNMLQSTGVV